MRSYLVVAGVFIAVTGAVVYTPGCASTKAEQDSGPMVVCKDAGGGQGEGCPCDPSSAMWKSPRACFEGPPAALKSGTACRSGKRTCSPEGIQGPCEGQVLPSPEVCDTQDNDCNGIIDDIASDEPVITDFSEAGLDPPIDAGAQCYVNGKTGLCAAGRYGCDPMGMKDCLPLISVDPDSGASPYMEVCNGLDDDCDGVVDNVDWAGQMCSVTYDDGGAPKGECAKGTRNCTNGVETCKEGQPQKETCNAKDDDCNGIIDDKSCPQQGLWCCRYNQSVIGCTSFNYEQMYGGNYKCSQ